MKLPSSWLFCVIALSLIASGLGYSIIFGQEGYFSIQTLEQKLDQLHMKNRKLKSDNYKIAIQVKDMEHGLEIIEYYARHDYLLIKPGEMVYRFLEP